MMTYAYVACTERSLCAVTPAINRCVTLLLQVRPTEASLKLSERPVAAFTVGEQSPQVITQRCVLLSVSKRVNGSDTGDRAPSKDRRYGSARVSFFTKEP
jgi:hypothetical protein